MKDFLLPREAEIEGIEEESPDTRTLALRAKGEEAPLPSPGQFNMVGLMGIGEAPISFSAISTQGRFKHTIRAVGRLTKVLARLEKGDFIHVRGPFGNGWPIEEAMDRDILVIAGGVGIVPLRPLIHHIIARRGEFGRLVLLYGARTPEDLLFKEELQAWKKQKDSEVLLTVDMVPEGVEWEENTGVVTTLFDSAEMDPHNCIVLTCGPEIMMRFVARSLLLREYPSSSIYLSLERRMKCGIGQCGHCQLGPFYVCRDGPVFAYDRVKGLPDNLL